MRSLTPYKKRNRDAAARQRSADARLRALFEDTPFAMVIMDEDGKLLDGNPAYQRLAGHGPEGPGALTWRDVTHPEDIEAEAELVDDLWSGRRTVYQLDKRCVRPDQAVVWMRVTGFLVGRFQEGGPLHAAILEDIDKQKAAEAESGTSASSLVLQFSAMRALIASDTLGEVVPVLLQALCETGGWDACTYWEVDGEAELIRCREIHHLPASHIPQFAAVHRALSLGCGKGVAGRVWEAQEATWTVDLEQNDWVGRGLKASREGIQTGVGVPVIYQGEVRAVLELFCKDKRRRDPAILQAMTTIAAQLARFYERIEAHNVLEASDTRFKRLTEATGDAVVTIGEEGCIIGANPATTQIFGYTQDELIGQPLTILMPEHLRAAHAEGLARYVASGQRSIRWDNQRLPGLHRDGSELALDISLLEYEEDGARTFTGLIRDVTEREHEESAVEWQSLHDTLTELPNRLLFQDRLQRAVLVGQRYTSSVGLIFLDLDRFKEVNDTFGHRKGDLLLKEVARRVQGTVRESDTLARLGGDEFALLLPSTDEVGAIRAAERIIDALRDDFVLEGQTFNVATSVGIAIYPDHGADEAILMQRAEAALYAAKLVDAAYTVFRAEEGAKDAVSLLLARELSEGIERDQFVLYYQPKVNLDDGRTEHVECLVRWIHPDRGFTSPLEFVPLAEETGLVKPLTVWTLIEALKQHKEWLKMGHSIRVGVNFSARLLADPTLVEIVTNLLKRYDVEPSMLEAEITESAMMVDPERALETLRALRNAGVWISVDDFGVGYSSLSYLKQLPVDEIKIDKSFVLDMATNRDDASIVRSVIGLGHNLGFQVVAEGVENKRTMDMLVSMDCDLAQGFFLSRPVPAAELTAWLSHPPLKLAIARKRA